VSYGRRITSDAAASAEPPDLTTLVAALRAVPELRSAAGEVLYLSINNRASIGLLRTAAVELRAAIPAGHGGRLTASVVPDADHYLRGGGAPAGRFATELIDIPAEWLRGNGFIR
jgi:hypothetical protein